MISEWIKERKGQIMGNISYRYKRTVGGYPGPGALTANLSRHHIFSYPFMLTFAVVVLHYLANSDDEKALRKLEAFYRARIRGGIPFHIGEFKNSALETKVDGNMGSLVWICWAEPNLFIGPDGAYRDDDPSQRMEFLPLSLPEKQKKLAQTVAVKWSAVSSSRIVGREDDAIRVSFDDRKLAEFADSFLDYINYAGPGGAQNIHRTTYDDWVLVKDQANARDVFRFVIKTGGSKKDVEGSFRFRLRESGMTPDRRGVSVTEYGDEVVRGNFRGAITEEELRTVF